jgi:hypothetical protein
MLNEPGENSAMADKYPDERTRKIIEWREAVGEIEQGDNATLPRLLKETETKTLMAVFESYDGALDDHRHFPDVAFWSAWDEEVMHALREELRRRGLVPLQGALGEGELGEAMRRASNRMPRGKKKQ